MQWYKKLTRSDARRKTKGGLMPFRFTKEDCPGNFRTWFREIIFGELDWKDSIGRDDQQEASVTLSVCILGVKMGQKVMKLTYVRSRIINHYAPTTHLQFDEDTKKYLQDNDVTGKYIVFSKDESTGNFKVVIQDNKPQRS